MTAPKNPKPVGLPITIPAAQAIANLQVSSEMDAQRAARRTGSGGNKVSVTMNALKPAAGGALFGQTGPQQRAPTKAERDAAAVHASYMVGDTTPSKVDLSVKDIAGPMLLEVTAIDCYDHNPRLFQNEKVEDIEASLRANGFHDALLVTRRRDGDRYMLAAGSNTTLRILQELWRTIQDDKYRWVNCIFQPFESDTRVLAQHLGENLNRGDMRFWEIAKGMMALLDGLEEEARTANRAAKVWNLREQADALTAMGLRANKSDVALWRFATQVLAALGDALPLLTNRGVSHQLQPRINALRSLAEKFKIDEVEFWGAVVNPTLKACGMAYHAGAEDNVFDASALCDQIEAHFAETIGESVASVRQMLGMLKLAPALTAADLRMPNVVGRGASSAPAVSGADDSAPPAATGGSQTNLPLGPAQVRGAGVNPPAVAPRPPAAVAPASALALPPAVQQPAPAAGELFAASESSQDPLQALHHAVEELLLHTGLQDTLRWRDEMPLGFFVEMPDAEIHARQRVAIGSTEYEARIVKTVVWWSLVLMSGQFREGCVPYIDQSSVFFRSYAADGEGNPLNGTDVESSPPEVDEMLMHRLTPGRMREAMQRLRKVEDAAAAMFAQRPERWRRMLEVRQST